MNKYIDELAGYLTRLNKSDLADTIEYYREYLIDGNFNNYDACVSELGTPRALANKILADESINTEHSDSTKYNEHDNTNSTMTIWLIIIAILGSPVWIPITGAVIILIIAMLIIAIAILLTLGAIIVSGIGSFFIVVFWSITNLMNHLIVSLLLFGLSLASLGISILLIPFTVGIARLLMKLIKSVSISLYKKTVRRNNAEKRRG
ncbi:DUF1700 domain-containing protein [Lactobacillus sp. Sy-1]|uniref:DUF1700 domain-containing protein n=1 Tax=Lactobacillus sp. Sy-1 TaxID=2109645 RepID=UPI001C5A972F|nr:DUF1700 domain-containing protein [Lactobacillus sp. Sy-1]MBW1606267.1 DUF1700 domain-containing protein [Lactobacillus sp. Sy-1]